MNNDFGFFTSLLSEHEEVQLAAMPE